jgi:hypothetical protein
MNIGINTIKLSMLLLIFIGEVNASSTYQKQIDKVATSAHELMNFNGTILVANSKEVIYQKSFGFADKDKKIKLTPSHQFAPGSIVKEFSTLAIMILEKQGEISYDDKITKYLTGFPSWASSITIEHILTHTSGLSEIKYKSNMSTADVVEQIKAVNKLEYKAGERFTYSNFNTVLRALIIEKVSGQSFNEFIATKLFSPVSMDNTFGRDNFSNTDNLISFGAKPLAIKGVTAYTTALDLYKWEKALWNNLLIDKKSMSKAILKPGLGGPHRAYFDFGFFKEDATRAISEIWHDGTYPSHYSLKSINFDKDLFIIILSSDGRRSTLSELKRSISNINQNGYLELPVIWDLTNAINLNGHRTAINNYKSRIINKESSASESEINQLGYDLYSQKKQDAALAIMKLNLELFPQSSNAHDSYAELLIYAKEYDRAIPVLENGIALAKKSNNIFLRDRFNQFLADIKKSKGQ